MHTFEDKKTLIGYLDKERLKKKKIGLIPTMGALHEGHLSLVSRAKEDSEIVVSSIFINPTQFNNPEDLEKYPRSLDSDLEKLTEIGCDAVYMPPIKDIYEDPEKLSTYLQFGQIETILEGKYRPGHFRGVGLIVAKLFNIIKPDFAYFGQKDLQQLHLIKQLIRDLSYTITLIAVPTKRESDGLAMSSRNRRISPEDRPFASAFYNALILARSLLKDGENIADTKTKLSSYLSDFSCLTLEYFEVVDTQNFAIVDHILNENTTALCIAGYINNIRLIDNVMYNN